MNGIDITKDPPIDGIGLTKQLWCFMAIAMMFLIPSDNAFSTERGTL